MRLSGSEIILFLTILVLISGSAAGYVNEGGATGGGDDGQIKCDGLNITVQEPSDGETGLSNPVHVEADITKGVDTGSIWDVKYNIDGGSNTTVTSSWFDSSQNPEVQGDISSNLADGWHNLFIYTDTEKCYATDKIKFAIGTGGSGEPTCYNINNDDDHDGADFSDEACVRPEDQSYVAQEDLDQTEGDAWDTDLSQTMGNPANVGGPGGRSLLFAETVYQNAEGNSGDSADDQKSGSSIVEQYITEARSEGDHWGYGELDSTTISKSDLPSGSILKSSGRVVFPPNPDASNDDDHHGDGIRQDHEDDSVSTVPKADLPGPDADTPVRSDWGRQWEKYDVKDPYDDKGTAGMECRDDRVDCNTAEVSCSDGSSSYPGCGSCSSSVVTAADCEYTAGDTSTDSDSGGYADDTGNYFWETDGDDIYREECTEDSGTIDSTSDDCDADSYSAECTDYNSTSGVCEGSWYCSSPSGDECSESTSDSLGDYRSWEEQNRIDCNTHNTVDGGSDQGYNDPAGTYTDFTAYYKDNWGSIDQDGDTEDGRVWCGYEKTITVDADGPRGLGDGFVVIDGDAGGVVATYNPKGNDEVGQKVRVVESTASGSKTVETEKNKLSGMVRGCGNGKDICLRYVDYYTSSSGWDNWEDAVKNDEEVYYPSDSYSVCKMINYINEKNGNGEELLDCDYERNGNDISPLPEACGDEDHDKEDLVAMEGPEVDDSEMEDLLGYQQRCVDYEEQSSVRGTSISEGACVYNGEIYAEGSLVNVADQDFKEDQGMSFEEGGDSNDPEVCISHPDFEGSTDDISPDNLEGDSGGAWYDLDNEDATTYLQNNGGSIDSDEWETATDEWGATYWKPNPDSGSTKKTETGIVEGPGYALEDDCHSSINCEEIGFGTGSQGPFYSSFEEGARTDDYAFDKDWLDINLTGFSNRVQAGTSDGNAGPGTGHTAGNTQDQETDLNLGPLENSQIDSDDDEWAITPDLTYVINNTGHSLEPEQCHGAPRDQDLVLDKRNRSYANSFANISEGLYNDEHSSGRPDGVWIDPDNHPVSAREGGTSCDLSGKDWGYGYSNKEGIGP